MTVVELGALGEFVGAFAMVATLIYLAVQIRQNTQTVQAAAVDASVGRINEVRKSIYEDAELSRIYLEGNAEPDALDDECRNAISNVHPQCLVGCMERVRSNDVDRYGPNDVGSSHSTPQKSAE